MKARDQKLLRFHDGELSAEEVQALQADLSGADHEKLAALDEVGGLRGDRGGPRGGGGGGGRGGGGGGGLGGGWLRVGAWADQVRARERARSLGPTCGVGVVRARHAGENDPRLTVLLPQLSKPPF